MWVKFTMQYGSICNVSHSNNHGHYSHSLSLESIQYELSFRLIWKNKMVCWSTLLSQVNEARRREKNETRNVKRLLQCSKRPAVSLSQNASAISMAVQPILVLLSNQRVAQAFMPLLTLLLADQVAYGLRRRFLIDLLICLSNTASCVARSVCPVGRSVGRAGWLASC